MADIKEEIIKSLNADLQLEHAARIQYLAHAEEVKGVNAEPVISRLKEIAGDEGGHEEKFRTLIGDYLGGIPAMGEAGTKPAKTLPEIFDANMKNEKHAIEQYKQTYRMIIDNRDQLLYVFERLEHDMRHIIMDEEEHVTELSRLMGI
ncbi:MAG: ferritin-like domain-containing protein [Deltaproteobacteria bacterium]